jgi:hypothetical protein
MQRERCGNRGVRRGAIDSPGSSRAPSDTRSSAPQHRARARLRSDFAPASLEPQRRRAKAAAVNKSDAKDPPSLPRSSSPVRPHPSNPFNAFKCKAIAPSGAAALSPCGREGLEEQHLIGRRAVRSRPVRPDGRHRRGFAEQAPSAGSRHGSSNRDGMPLQRT